MLLPALAVSVQPIAIVTLGLETAADPVGNAASPAMAAPILDATVEDQELAKGKEEQILMDKMLSDTRKRFRKLMLNPDTKRAAF